jgi:hypothetical protein
MRKQLFVPMLVGMLALGAVQAFAQSATVVMRNGDRVRADVIDMGRNFTLNVNGQTREVPIGDIVLIDFAGDGRNVSGDEISKVNAANGGYVVMRNGEQFNASLQDFTGKPLIAVFSNGRRSSTGDVARIYLGSVNNVPGFPTQSASNPSVAPNPPNPPMPERPAGWRGRGRGNRDPYADRSAAPPDARSVVVPSNVQWTNTGLNVSRGQYLRFEPSGEIRLSTNGDDVARAAGALSFRHADKATIPSIPVGALIGRIGNGQPFSIGDTNNAFDMPDSGRLYLGVNDDHVPDNSGNFVVKIWEP